MIPVLVSSLWLHCGVRRYPRDLRSKRPASNLQQWSGPEMTSLPRGGESQDTAKGTDLRTIWGEELAGPLRVWKRERDLQGDFQISGVSHVAAFGHSRGQAGKREAHLGDVALEWHQQGRWTSPLGGPRAASVLGNSPGRQWQLPGEVHGQAGPGILIR